MAQYDFYIEKENYLNFKKGNILEVFKKTTENWWWASFNGKSGYIPSNYVTIHKEEINKVEKSTPKKTPPRVIYRQDTETRMFNIENAVSHWSGPSDKPFTKSSSTESLAPTLPPLLSPRMLTSPFLSEMDLKTPKTKRKDIKRTGRRNT